jgi:LysM repeat protein
MATKRIGVILTFVIIASSLALTACQISASQAPINTPTPLPEDLFPNALPTSDNPMAMLEVYATETALAGGVMDMTPATDTALTPGGTEITPDTSGLITPTPTSDLFTVATATNIIATSAVVPTAGNLTRPASYSLQRGEWPWCIARRYNIDPNGLLTANGLTPDQGSIYQPGLTLTIPSTLGAFPGDRALRAHPATHTVTANEETLYAVACYYGDVDPAAIAQANNLSLSASLTVGQSLQIP